jgi:hypothetical protein
MQLTLGSTTTETGLTVTSTLATVVDVNDVRDFDFFAATVTNTGGGQINQAVLQGFKENAWTTIDSSAVTTALGTINPGGSASYTTTRGQFGYDRLRVRLKSTVNTFASVALTPYALGSQVAADGATATAIATDTISEATSAAGVTIDGVKLKDGGIDLSSTSPTTHPILLSSMTLPASSNAIRGVSVNPTRSSGWISFSGTIGATPAQCYTDYRELHTTGVAEVLGGGFFPFMDSGASCASMFAGQFIAEADAGSTVLTAGGVPGVGIFATFNKVLLNGETFNSGGVAAVQWLSFQANVTDVSAEDTSIWNAEVASGGIQNILKFQCTAAAGATYFLNFTDDNGSPASNTNGTDLADISATPNAGWIKCKVGSTIKYIPLYSVKAP